MTQVVAEPKRATSKKIINAKLVTVIANSRAEYNIYTYSATAESHFDIKDEGFFNPTYTFATVGDVFRIFRLENKEIVNYYEFLITKVDKLNKIVRAVSLVEKNIKKAGDN